MKVSIYDLMILHSYFSAKNEPTDQDKARLQKIDEALCLLVDGMGVAKNNPDIAEIFEKLTGEKLENYRAQP